MGLVVANLNRRGLACPSVEMATFGENLKAAREERGLSAKEVADRMGVGTGQYSNWENDRFGLPATQTVIRAAKAIGCPISRLVKGIDPEYDAGAGKDDVQGFVDVSTGYVPDDLPVIFEGEATPKGSLFWDGEGKLLKLVTNRMSRPPGVSDREAYGVVVRGDSMAPRYEPGEILVVSPNKQVRTGLRCYVQLRSGERLIKTVRKTIGGWMLESINQAYPPREVRDEEIEFMHRVVASRERDDAPGELRVVDEDTGRRLPPKANFDRNDRPDGRDRSDEDL